MSRLHDCSSPSLLQTVGLESVTSVQCRGPLSCGIDHEDDAGQARTVAVLFKTRRVLEAFLVALQASWQALFQVRFLPSPKPSYSHTEPLP